MAQQTIDATEGAGESLPSGFSKANANFTELYSRTPPVVSFDGGAADDTAAFLTALGVAVAANVTLVCEADEYNINPTALGEITDSVSIRFGPNTVIDNLQTSGTKLATLRFAGTGLTGSAISVTALESGGLKNEITVADATGFAVGDTVLLSENEAAQTPTQFDTAPVDQDFNYREYLTIAAIDGSNIEFEEFLRFPYDTNNTLRLQKVGFLENVRIWGGVFKGANATGGGVEFTHCRNSTVQNIRCVGNSEADKNGGSPIKATDCWLCGFDGITANLTHYVIDSRRNQSCGYSRVVGKRTTSGGMIINGDRFCQYTNTQQDASGDNNGDSFQIANGARHNLIVDAMVHGASCYTIWMHESCDDNRVIALKSTSGITTGLNIYGNRNVFSSCSIIGHGGAGISDGGTDNSFPDTYVDGAGNGAFLHGTNTYLEGVVRTSSSTLRDIQFNNATGCKVRTRGGTSRGVNQSGTNSAHNIQHEGDSPLYEGRTIVGRGWIWSKSHINLLTPTPTNVPLIQDDDTIVDWVSRNSGDIGVCYKVTLAANISSADTASEYVILDRQNNLYIREIYKGSGSPAPELTLSGGGNLQVSSASGSTFSLLMTVQRF